MAVRTIVLALIVLFSSLTGTAGAVGEWVLTFTARDQAGNPVAGVCFAYSFLDPTVQQTYSGTSCTAATGSNNVAFGAQVQAADVTQSVTPAGCTGGLAGTVHVLAGTPSVDAVLTCGSMPPAPPPPPPPPPPSDSANRIPLATNDSYGIPRDGTLYANLLKNDTDPDGDAIHVALIQNEMRGARFSLADNGTFVYQPKKGFTGTVRLQYQAVDSHGAKSQPATAAVRVSAQPSGAPPASLPKPGKTSGSSSGDHLTKPPGTSLPPGSKLKGAAFAFPAANAWFGEYPFRYGWYWVCSSTEMGIRPFIFEGAVSGTEYFQMFVKRETLGIDGNWHGVLEGTKTHTSPRFRNDSANRWDIFPNNDDSGVPLLWTPTLTDLDGASYRFKVRWEWLDDRTGRDVFYSRPKKEGANRGNDFFIASYCTPPSE